MKKLALIVLGLLAIGCGGGGGGGGSSSGSATLVGRVLSVSTGSGISPAARVSTTTANQLTSADGSFTVSAANLTGSVSIDTLTAFGVWNFTFTPATGTKDIGDLWVGPQRITLSGRVLDSTNGIPISGAIVSFAGGSTTTASNGTFSLNPVPYDASNQPVFWGIQGTAIATSYFATPFNAAPNVPVSGVVTVGDILLTPSSDTTPPNPPYAITGRVLPIGTSTGTVVTLLQSSVAKRVFNVGADGRYSFWIGPGSYTITYSKGSLTAPTQNVTVNNLGDTVSVPDVTLQ